VKHPPPLSSGSDVGLAFSLLPSFFCPQFHTDSQHTTIKREKGNGNSDRDFRPFFIPLPPLPPHPPSSSARTFSRRRRNAHHHPLPHFPALASCFTTAPSCPRRRSKLSAKGSSPLSRQRPPSRLSFRTNHSLDHSLRSNNEMARPSAPVGAFNRFLFRRLFLERKKTALDESVHPPPSLIDHSKAMATTSTITSS
jgi:hypothetical protein